MPAMGEPLVVRAEIMEGTRRIVAHTSDVGEEVVVRTDVVLAPGTPARVRLSLGELMPTLELDTRVVDATPGDGHGYLPSLRLRPDGEDRGALARFVASLAGGALTECRLLVVEDSEIMRDCVSAAAARAVAKGHRLHIDSAPNAEDALALAASRSYDLALVDFFLPGMDGAQMVRELRARPAPSATAPRQSSPLRRVNCPAVIGFSVGGAAARDAFLAAGADVFLDKPVMIRDLLTTLALLAGAASRRGEMKRILLMDDSPVFLEVAKLALERAGYEVECVADLAELQRARSHSPSLVLMDVQMPEAFGDDVALTLKHTYGISAPIYLLSSLSDADLADRVQWAQIEGFISKNRGVDVMIEEVRRILDTSEPAA
jgi:CheY-like chemotaxis protein